MRTVARARLSAVLLSGADCKRESYPHAAPVIRIAARGRMRYSAQPALAIAALARRLQEEELAVT
jgi:hypothetical protein